MTCKWRLGTELAIFVLAGGCASPANYSAGSFQTARSPAEFRYVPDFEPPPDPADLAYKGTTRSWDPYAATESITSPLFQPQGTEYRCELIRLKDADKIVFTLMFVYIGPLSNGLPDLNSAKDRHARSFPVRPMGPDIKPESEKVSEWIAIMFTRPYLDAASDGEGLDLRIYGERGSCDMKLPAASIKGFLKKVDEVDSGASSRPAD